MKKYFPFGILFLVSFFLLACQGNEKVIVQVKNELDLNRTNETVVIKAEQLKNYFPNDELKFVQVFDQKTGKEVVSQLIDYNQDSRFEKLIFQSDFSPKESKKFILKQLKKEPESTAESKVFARFVPERMDDFAWENDRIAFRMYGPALEAETSGSGVDVWVKRTRDLIINKWYKLGDYHVDHGEGYDGYKVGTSRGCGGLALWDSGKMVPSKNFTKWRLMANGQIRTAFQLDYGPWKGDLGEISEYKRVVLDAGSNLNRFESSFLSDDYRLFDVAIGIVKGKNGSVKMNPKEGWLRYWTPLAGDNGMVGCGIVIAPKKIKKMIETENHYLVIVETNIKERLIYYAGACWSKSGDFNSVTDWDVYLEQFAKKVASPLKIEILE